MDLNSSRQLDDEALTLARVAAIADGWEGISVMVEERKAQLQRR